MPIISTYIGGAGVGKTTTLLNTMAELIEKRYPDPRSIGFVSFTRAARQEAASRAADRFNIRVAELERDGWFRTLHSVCYKLLGVGDRLLVPGRATQNWVRDMVQAEVTGTGEANPDGDSIGRPEQATPADMALEMWCYARNAMVPLEVVHDRAWKLSAFTPEIAECRRVAERYEQAKRLNNRVDFTDLLSQFAGVSFSPKHGPSDVAPLGEVPDVPVWFLDEAQDNSALIDRAARRLTGNADMVYLSGDPFQAVHSWAGGDHRLFQNWNRDRVKILDQSYRCPEEILNLGEACLRPCSDYWDRKIKPRPEVEKDVYKHPQTQTRSKTHAHFFDPEIRSLIYTATSNEWAQRLDPRESWLLLARTNFQARRLMAMVKNLGIPWRPLRGNGGWNAPIRNLVCQSLMGIEENSPIDFEMWTAIVKQIPTKSHGHDLLVRGVKAAWEKGEYDSHCERMLLRENLHEWGATKYMIDQVVSGGWVTWVENGTEFRSAVRRYGYTAAMCQEGTRTRGGALAGIRIGTCHSAKGMEGDNVVLLTTSSAPVARSAALDDQGADEERRVSYVGVTRARERLYVFNEKCRDKMPVPLAGEVR